MNHCSVIILAAGKGTRMKSDKPKVLHQLAGLPLLAHVVAAVRGLLPTRIVVVVGFGGAAVQSELGDGDLTYVTQQEQLGTAHAVQTALPALADQTGEVIILNGDTPLIQTPTLQGLLGEHRREDNTVTVLSTKIDPPTGYGRIVRDRKGRFLEIVEENDAIEAIRQVNEVNSGAYCVEMATLPDLIQAVEKNPDKGEYYLTDIVKIAQKRKKCRVDAFEHPDAVELKGVNSRQQLATLEREFRDRLVDQHMTAGVTFIDPTSCWLAADARIGRDSVLEPGVILGQGVTIGEGCRIGAYACISRSQLGPGSQILPYTHMDGATLTADNQVGPFARLRPGTTLAARSKVGNFCEIKKAEVGEDSKINHLSYIGDAQVGTGVNIGAGTITCNYDGERKHVTKIGDGAFIGSDVQLVAPVQVGQWAIVGAGTTVTRNVPDKALATTRAPQKHTDDYRERRAKRPLNKVE